MLKPSDQRCRTRSCGAAPAPAAGPPELGIGLPVGSGIVRLSTPSPPTVWPAPRKVRGPEGPAGEEAAGSPEPGRFELLETEKVSYDQHDRQMQMDLRFRLGDDIVDQLLGVIGSLVGVLNSETGLLASGKKIARSVTLVIGIIFIVVVIVVVQRAEGSYAFPLRGFLGSCRLRRRGRLRRGPSIKRTWAGVFRLWGRYCRLFSGEIGGCLLSVGEEGGYCSLEIPGSCGQVFCSLVAISKSTPTNPACSGV